MATATTLSPITTHVLDTARGQPAAGIQVKLESLSGDKWQDLSQAATNKDGRVAGLITPGTLKTGVYRLTFDTSAYFRELGQESFYPYVTVTFEIKEPTQHYHVPLLLSPFGYTTYRGS
jgi:5-hydroxyisourate hydrolase